MKVKIRFQIYRVKNRNIGKTSKPGYQSMAMCSLHGKMYSMAELQDIVDKYTVGCEPTFKRDNDRPMIDHFVLEFEDYMYNAFLIAET